MPVSREFVSLQMQKIFPTLNLIFSRNPFQRVRECHSDCNRHIAMLFPTCATNCNNHSHIMGLFSSDKLRQYILLFFLFFITHNNNFKKNYIGLYPTPIIHPFSKALAPLISPYLPLATPATDARNTDSARTAPASA